MNTKMKKTSYLILIVTLILGVQACDSTNKNNSLASMMPNCTGKAGELVLVIEEEKWQSNIGDTILNILAKEMLALPQPEPSLDVVQIPISAFSDLFQTNRNLMFVNIAPEHKEPKITIESDRWAKPQIVVRIKAPNKEEFFKIFRKHGQKVRDTFVTAEKYRFLSTYRKHPVINIEEKLRTKHHISMRIPKGYILEVDKDNFAWIAHETNRISQGILVYSYPYADTSDFSLNSLILKKDSVWLNNVPGAVDDSFMATEKRLPIHRTEFMNNNNYTCELRGLWMVEGDFMGGPFVSYSMVDTVRNKVVVVDAYVYAGKLEKRNYVWQVEGILKSIRLLP